MIFKKLEIELFLYNYKFYQNLSYFQRIIVSIEKMSIKSKYIYDIIFSYINDENFKYKLFKYSKENQSKISINLTDYKNIYYNSLDFNLDDYLLYKYNNTETNFDIKYLTKKLNEDLIKFDIDIKDFESAVDYYLKIIKQKNII